MTHEELINSKEYRRAKIEILLWNKRNLFYFVLFCLLLSFFVGCKTKTVLVENVRNTKDSTENVQLRSDLQSTKFLLSESEKSIELLKKEIIKFSEQINATQNEKELLNEKLTTIIEKFDENGVLRERVFSERLSEIAKELSRSEQKIKLLEKELDESKQIEESIVALYNQSVSEKVDLIKKVEFLEKENKDVKLKESSKPKFQWYLLLIGFFIGILFYYYFELGLRKIINLFR